MKKIVCVAICVLLSFVTVACESVDGSNQISTSRRTTTTIPITTTTSDNQKELARQQIIAINDEIIPLFEEYDEALTTIITSVITYGLTQSMINTFGEKIEWFSSDYALLSSTATNTLFDIAEYFEDDNYMVTYAGFLDKTTECFNDAIHAHNDGTSREYYASLQSLLSIHEERLSFMISTHKKFETYIKYLRNKHAI